MPHVRTVSARLTGGQPCRPAFGGGGSCGALSHFKLPGSVSERLKLSAGVARRKTVSRERNGATPLEAYRGSFCCLNNCLRFILALCNCDFDVPTEQPNNLATSSCSCPSTSCKTKTARYPGGN